MDANIQKKALRKAVLIGLAVFPLIVVGIGYIAAILVPVWDSVWSLVLIIPLVAAIIALNYSVVTKQYKQTFHSYGGSPTSILPSRVKIAAILVSVVPITMFVIYQISTGDIDLTKMPK